MTVAVLGASGGVGRAAVRRLHALGLGPLRLGGRRLSAVQAVLAEELAGIGEAVSVDLHDGAALAAFCAGAHVVLSCAGPSAPIGDRIAAAALAAGADYVDAGGDERLHALLEGRVLTGARALVSAGIQPGLSGLLVRALAERADGSGELVAHAGGLGRFTYGAAADYLAGLDTAGTPLAAWHDGAVVPVALAPRREVAIDGFPGRVHAQPFLPYELERIARGLDLRAAEWWTVFDGERVPDVLARRAGAQELMAAARLDAFGRVPYHRFVLHLRGADGSATATLRARDPIALTGDVAALTVAAVIREEVPAGLGYAGETLAPAPMLSALRGCASVESLALSSYEGCPAGEELLVEGVL